MPLFGFGNTVGFAGDQVSPPSLDSVWQIKPMPRARHSARIDLSFRSNKLGCMMPCGWLGTSMYNRRTVLLWLHNNTVFQQGKPGSSPAISGFDQEFPSSRASQILTSLAPSSLPPKQADRNRPGAVSTIVDAWHDAKGAF